MYNLINSICAEIYSNLSFYIELFLSILLDYFVQNI